MRSFLIICVTALWCSAVANVVPSPPPSENEADTDKFVQKVEDEVKKEHLLKHIDELRKDPSYQENDSSRTFDDNEPPTSSGASKDPSHQENDSSSSSDDNKSPTRKRSSKDHRHRADKGKAKVKRNFKKDVKTVKNIVIDEYVEPAYENYKNEVSEGLKKQISTLQSSAKDSKDKVLLSVIKNLEQVEKNVMTSFGQITTSLSGINRKLSVIVKDSVKDKAKTLFRSKPSKTSKLSKKGSKKEDGIPTFSQNELQPKTAE